MWSNEFVASVPLRWSLGALIFCYFIVFSAWVRDSAISLSSVANNSYLCPPYFQSCDQLYFLEALPYGYSQTFFYMLLFAGLLYAVYLLSEKQYQLVQWMLIPAFLWHAANTFLLTEYHVGNYEYYLFVFGLVLLFLPHKEFFLKLSIVMFYVISTMAKLHPSWIEGTYFSSLITGLPLFPDWSIPIWTNLVIFFEMVVAWFLLSSNRILQRASLVFFIIFHLYSGILVEYRYPATVLPMLLTVFGPWYRYTVPPLDKKSLWGWGLAVLLVCMQLVPQAIEGDEKLTLEGNRYGLYMFEANHQCISQAVVHLDSGETQEVNYIGVRARNRCNPYNRWFEFQNICSASESVARIEWTFDHSINGDPFLRIVDVDDVCPLEYKAFSHNEWIKTHADNPEVIGWPVKNIYH